MPHPDAPIAPVARLVRAELSYLLTVRPAPATAVVRDVLGLAAQPDETALDDGLASLLVRGLAEQRPHALVPVGDAAALVEVVAGARQVDAVRADDLVLAVVIDDGDRALLIVPMPLGIVELSAIDASRDPGDVLRAAGDRAEQRGAHAAIDRLWPAKES